MSLADYYGISEEAANRMVKNGHVSCSVLMHLEIYEAYKSMLGKGLTKEAIYSELSIDFKLSHSTIKFAVLNMDKKS